MRLLVLVLNILISSSLLAQPTEILAASANTKADKNNHQRGHTKNSRGKNKAHQLLRIKQKSIKNPGNVWERIRSGMQIPRPGLVTIPPEQAPAPKNNDVSVTPPIQSPLPTLVAFNSDSITSDTSGLPALPLHASPGTEKTLESQKHKLPHTASAPINNYTRYARLKLKAIAASRIRTNLASPEQLFASRNNKLTGAATQSRLRTRIDFHPELGKPELKSHTNLSIDNASSLTRPVKAELLANSIPDPDFAKQQIMYDRVNKHTVWYTQHRDYLQQVARRAQPYLYHVVESLSQHKLPYELALLPIVESAYQPTALSPKSAAGLWQFIPSTGHDFDLQQSDQYDARLDIIASTQAATRYLSFLRQHFNGDWLLALAAYNCGLGTVDNAIKRNRDEGLDTDYWSLRLPEETLEYVPRFLALSGIFSNPVAHGLKLAPVMNEPYFVKVKIERKHDIEYLAEKDFKEVAELANLSYEQFNLLNPGYLNPKLAANGPFTFLMPAANANQLHQRLTSIAQFLDQPATILTAHAPLRRRALSTDYEQKTALTLLSDITLPKAKDPITMSNPFLSLNLDGNQTTPRLANQLVILPDAQYTSPKRVKKNI